MSFSKTFAGITLLAVLFTVYSCGGNKSESQSVPTTDTLPTEQPTCLSAIENYLVAEIGALYSKGDVCIPYYEVVYTDDTDTTDIRVWGDWWVDNYNIAGDTLITVSGGNHPGLFHVQKTGAEFKVTAFDQVVDGAGNTESAKRIFGEHYDEYLGYANDCGDVHAEVRTKAITLHAKKHGLKVTMYKDYGWPAVALK